MYSLSFLGVILALANLLFNFRTLVYGRFFQSFQFLVDVFEFKNELLLLEAGSDERARTFKGFGGYLAIVNDYIKDGSHSEVNIDSRTKRDILAFATFNIYSSLDTVRQIRGGDTREMIERYTHGGRASEREIEIEIERDDCNWISSVSSEVTQ